MTSYNFMDIVSDAGANPDYIHELVIKCKDTNLRAAACSNPAIADKTLVYLAQESEKLSWRIYSAMVEQLCMREELSYEIASNPKTSSGMLRHMLWLEGGKWNTMIAGNPNADNKTLWQILTDGSQREREIASANYFKRKE